jgi:SAM-dependent methyltransferase
LLGENDRAIRARVFVDESLWIRRVLERQPFRAGVTVLDVGSSSLHFRTVVQPHIDANVFAPLRARGMTVTHVDARNEPGVDLVDDVTKLERVDRTYDLVLCTNLLEHVTDRAGTVENLKRVVTARGLLLLTVPKRYPIHADPIDTGFRPRATELSALLGWDGVLAAEDVSVRDPLHYRDRGWYRRWLHPWQSACLLARRPAG